MGLFNKLKEPIFLKENSSAEKQLEELKKLEPFLSEEGKIRLRQDIKCLEYGIAGEKAIAYELKNSYMPMYILHDVYLKHGELEAQIDYLVFTRKLCFAIECKNLFGNIEINSDGNFIRTMELGGKKIREGLYSPITQNERHLELIKKIKMDGYKNKIAQFIIEKGFEDSYKSLVVMANQKTILNDRYAKKEIKNQVIKIDQLITYIKEMCRQSEEAELSDKRLLEWSQSFYNLHVAEEKDYSARYEKYLKNNEIENKTEQLDKTRNINSRENINYIECNVIQPNHSVAINESNIEDMELYKELKAYRLHKSREENIKPYYIYNNDQLKNLIVNMPANQKELQHLSGFGENKASKYGQDILGILNKYR